MNNNNQFSQHEPPGASPALTHDFDFEYCEFASRTKTSGQAVRARWSDFVARCETPRRTSETRAQLEQWLAASADDSLGADERSHARSRADAVKDVGGFVAGRLRDNTRGNRNVEFRTAVVLDLDEARPDTWDKFVQRFSTTAACVYATHKSVPERPRLRIVLPSARPMDAAEYAACTAWWQEQVCGDTIEADSCSAVLGQLMYWGSCPSDVRWFAAHTDGTPFDPDSCRRGPAAPATEQHRDTPPAPAPRSEPRGAAASPLREAFNRAYAADEAIEAFLTDIYVRESEGVYSYRGADSRCGLKLYRDPGSTRWERAYSFHATDPLARRMLDAWDLVRLARWQALDKGARRNIPPSFDRMAELARNDPRVRAMLLPAEAHTVTRNGSASALPADAANSWQDSLELNNQGLVCPTRPNIKLILDNDPEIAGKLQLNLLTYNADVYGTLPWKRRPGPWQDCDNAQLRLWLEHKWHVNNRDAIADVRKCVMEDNSYHPVRDYLTALQWDGTPRLDTVGIRYLGAADTPLNRVIFKRWMVSAIGRVMNPGSQADYVLTLMGPEGCYKSTFFRVLASPEWFTDSIYSMEGKDGMDAIRGKWIAELAELASTKSSEVETIKSFITRREDYYRPAYAETSCNYPRQIVFGATTNESHPLKSKTGDRRFWLCRVDPARRDLSIGNIPQALADNRDQLWAEALVLWKNGEKTWLEPELESEMTRIRDNSNINALDEMADDFEKFLNTPLPSNFYSLPMSARKAMYGRHTWCSEDERRSIEKRWDTRKFARTRFWAKEFLEIMYDLRPSMHSYNFKASQLSRWLTARGWDGPRTLRCKDKSYDRNRGFLSPGASDD